MYRGQSGQWSWLLHRITGLGVLLFLLVHIVDITLIGFGPKVYNDSIAIFSTALRAPRLAGADRLRALPRLQRRAHHHHRLLARRLQISASRCSTPCWR